MARPSPAHPVAAPDSPPFASGRLLAIAAAYLVAHGLAEAWSIEPGGIPAVWPPAGVAFAGFLMFPRRAWPWLAIALLATAGGASAAADRAWILSAAFAASDLALGAAGAWAYPRIAGGSDPLEGLQPLAQFVGLAVLGAIAWGGVAAAVAGSLDGLPFEQIFQLFLGSALLGLVLAAPLMLSAGHVRSAAMSRSGVAESGIVFLLLSVVSILGFSEWLGQSRLPLLAVFTPVPFLIWLSVRRTALETLAALLVVSLIEMWSTAHDFGPAVRISEALPDRILWLQVFLTTRAGTILILCAVVAARTRFEQLAREREVRLRSIVDTIPDAIVTIDERGIIDAFSPAAERLFGYAAAEAIGRNVKMLMPPFDRDRHDDHIARYLRTGERRVIGTGRIVVAQRKDGSTFPVELAVGEAVHEGRHAFIGFLRDISERQKVEQRLHELQDDLLRVSRLSAMSELASALAHELNQPLAAIKNYGLAGRHLLHASAERREKVVEILDRTIEQATRAGEIIRRLRSFLQKREVETVLEDLNKVIEEASALALIGINEKGIRVAMERATDLPPVLIDKIQIQQVLINLIRNAIDAMHESPRRELLIRSQLRDAAVIVSVVDSGPGIQPSVADKLFHPFVTTKQGGMGVGLSMSRNIVEAHNGRLWCEANPSGGATFHMALPAAVRASAAAQAGQPHDVNQC
jgi:two-component system sensor kinase FixL